MYHGEGRWDHDKHMDVRQKIVYVHRGVCVPSGVDRVDGRQETAGGGLS